MRALLLLTLFIPFLNGCCSDPIDGSSYFCVGEMSLEEELSLGKSYAPTIDATYGGVYADAEADQYLGSLIREMAKKSVYGPTFQWNFSILNTSLPNAFAVPGGYIYITRGLLAAMETEGQFISVMGHELGHVEHRHSHQGMGRQVLGSVFVGVVDTGFRVATGAESSGIVGGLANAGAGLVSLSYDRGQELQADTRGVFYAANMGYDPMEGVKTFEYFKKLEEESGGSQVEFLRTHPLNDHRIDDIKEEVQTNYPQVLTKPAGSFRPQSEGNSRFQQIVARIKKVQPIYDQYDKATKALNEATKKGDKQAISSALSTLESCASQVPGEALFHTAIGAAKLELGQKAPARTSLQKAVSLDESYLPQRRLFQPHYLLGAIALDGGEAKAAANEYRIASGAFPQHAPSYYYLGVSLEESGDKTGARTAYQKAIDAEGDASGQVTQKANERLKNL